MAHLESLVLFLLVPLLAFGVGAATLFSSYADIRQKHAGGDATGSPKPRGRFFSLSAILVTPVIFGFILWALSLPFVDDLEAAVTPEAQNVARVHLWTGIAYASTACVTIASEVSVACHRMKQALGVEFGRVLSLVVIPETLWIFCLILVFLILEVVRDVVDLGFGLTAGVDETILGLQVFAASTLATPLAITISNRVSDLDSRGFIRALIPAEAGVAVTIAALAYAFLQIGLLSP